MSAKMKRYIDKLRGRQNTLEKCEGDNVKREDVKGEHGNGYNGKGEDGKGGDSEEEDASDKKTVVHVATSTYESKGTCTGEYDGPNERFSRLKGIKRVPTKKQEIGCEVTYWGPTKRIEEARLVALLKSKIKTGGEVHYKLIDQLSGSFNVAYILESDRGGKVCVRIPACGFPNRWTQKDADLLQATALGMKYIANNSKLPIPEVLGYSTDLENEIKAPFIIMSFLKGESVLALWDDKSVARPVLEARRQKIMHSLANIMCTLSTTTFAQAGTLWFASDGAPPVVGHSYRLRKDSIFAVHHDFVTFPSKGSVAELLRGDLDKRFAEDLTTKTYRSPANNAVYALWGLMIEAFIRSDAKVDAGEPEFVLMQSDFNPQNILADKAGNVTGLIDWDCLEAIPRQIGWCSLPHWLESDWYPDYHWPPDIGIDNVIKPDGYDRYRQDYTEYLREACGGEAHASLTDAVFTSRSHIYQALFDSAESFERVECFVCNVMSDILPRIIYNFHTHVEDIGERGFREGEQAWFEERLTRYFAPGAELVMSK